MLSLRSAAPVVLLLAVADPSPSRQQPNRPEAVRGVTISTHGSGRDWGSDRMMETMRSVRDVGAGWVAIHPYAGIRADGRVTVRGLRAAEPPAWLVRPIREAHGLGLKILIKPHLAYWGSPFRWRGEIAFERPEAWRRFWAGYRQWIVTLARVCRDADALVVGTELDRTLDHEREWRELIAAVRAETHAPLTYAANWTDYQRVAFWDALDAVGIQAYFPLSDAERPNPTALAAAWRQRMASLRAYSERVGRRIVFTELGYDCSHLAAARPWEPHRDGAAFEPLQLDCMRAALRAIAAEPSVVGAFLWKWFPAPDRRRGGDFRLDTPAMKALLRGLWH